MTCMALITHEFSRQCLTHFIGNYLLLQYTKESESGDYDIGANPSQEEQEEQSEGSVKTGIIIIISQDESRVYTDFTFVVLPPLYVLTCVHDNSKMVSQISFKLGTHVFVSGEEPYKDSSQA